MTNFKGSMVALITPFKNGKIDERTYRKLIDFQIENGTDGIVPCGTTGEAATMSHEEHRRTLEVAIEHVAGRVPVICGAGSNSTNEAVGLVKYAKKIKADCALVVTPYYNKPTQEGLFRHYREIADKVNIPVMLYNVPSRTGSNLLPETVVRLHRACSNIVAVKEASGSIDQTSEILTMCDITVISGDDGITLPLISVGAKGVISVAANIIPGEIAHMVHCALNEEMEAARDMHLEWYELMKLLFIESNPIPVKTAASMMGLCSGEVRLPLCEMRPENLKLLKACLSHYGLLRKTRSTAKKIMTRRKSAVSAA